jgi:hypothetical protein
MDPEIENKNSPSPKSPNKNTNFSDAIFTNLKKEFIPFFKKVFQMGH